MHDRWSDLCPDVLDLISDHLPLHDRLRLRAVCTAWRSALPPFPASNPWLLLYALNPTTTTTTCILYSSSSPKPWPLNLPELCEGSTCLAHNQGLLLVRHSMRLFLLDPFTGASLPLPDIPDDFKWYTEILASFTYSTDVLFVFFHSHVAGLIHHLLVYHSRRGQSGQWRNKMCIVEGGGVAHAWNSDMAVARAFRDDAGAHFVCSDAKGNVVRYDAADDKFRGWREIGAGTARAKALGEAVGGVAARHARDWLARFGEGGFALRVCGGRMGLHGCGRQKNVEVPFGRVEVGPEGNIDRFE
ncbi:hypothetical protein QJS10_CPB14g00708 [Acorus calamus]|uniref:F-box domain-containing protein n=1 Tax=Acorus calamus TaxID=4465 RepID=A0AAV9DDC8_ACOCL|nr:hypothetical protein QJS10_CPB14g00708 [Acorus calamus]